MSYRAVEDYLIFFCRIARVDPTLIGECGQAAELLCDAAGGCRSAAFWHAFVEFVEAAEAAGAAVGAARELLEEAVANGELSVCCECLCTFSAGASESRYRAAPHLTR
jgi:hypothetical protein